MSEKRELRIVYMGTPEFAVAGLKALLDANYEVVAVVTAPDKPAGRGRKMKASAVKEFALTQGLPILQPEKLRNEYFNEALRSFEANLFVVVAFRMLPKMVWASPEYGTFNLHASLLPQYRGAAPINWAIINGETKTGVTTFFIDDKIDTGEIILQREISIENDETAGSLHDKLMHLGSDLILETVSSIENEKAIPFKQPDVDDVKKAPKIYREDCKINWEDDIEYIYNLVRGLSPFPAAWCILKNGDEEIEAKLYKTHYEKTSKNSNFGAIDIEKDHLRIWAKNGYLSVYEIKLSGKRKMDVRSLLNGYDFNSDAKML